MKRATSARRKRKPPSLAPSQRRTAGCGSKRASSPKRRRSPLLAGGDPSVRLRRPSPPQPAPRRPRPTSTGQRRLRSCPSFLPRNLQCSCYGSHGPDEQEQSMTTRASRHPFAVLALVAVFATQSLAQTPVNAPKNKYDPADDVKIGREAAAEVERQMPLLHDDRVSSYVEELGDRLVDTIPADLRHPEFRYTFKVVDVKEINAFALPGGPMYVNRGMIESAKTEGEV